MYYFIINPHASDGKGLKIWQKVNKYLLRKNRSLAYESFITEKNGDARDYARQLTEKCTENRVITVIGGDGTLNEVVDGICLDNDLISIAFIPTSINNDFARCFKKRYTLSRQLDRLFTCDEETRLDYGVLSCINGNRRFVVSSGIGFDAAVFHDLIAERLAGKRRAFHSNHLTYYFSFIKELFRAKRTRGYVVLDNDTRIEYNNIIFISVHVHPYECGCKLGPAANGEDGYLDICIVSTKKKSRLIGIMLSSIIGAHQNMTGVHTYRCRSIEIHTAEPLPVHTDGEFCNAAKDLNLSCIPRKLRIRT